MPTTALDIAPALLTSSEMTIIVVPASHEYDLPVIRFVNTASSGSIQLTIWNKTSASGGVNADAESLVSIQPQSTYEHGPMVLAAARQVSVAASTSGFISCRPHGWDIS